MSRFNFLSFGKMTKVFSVAVLSTCVLHAPALAEEISSNIIIDLQDAEFSMEESFDMAAPLSGRYQTSGAWVKDDARSTSEKEVYVQSAYMDLEATSTISCKYIDTSYSIAEYEQLRDMLTNNLLYDNVNAQLSTSAAYTNAKDYLYIVYVDDSAKEYREIYYYVVGDYRCFEVKVQEYRREAQNAEAQSPEAVGAGIAKGFVWDY